MAQEVKIKDEEIEAIKNWPKPMLIRDIQIFIGFANFYQRLIQDFSKIVALLTLMLKTTGLFKKLGLKQFKANNNEVVDDGGGRANRMIVNLSKNKKSRKSTRVPNIGAIRKPSFLNSDAKKVFNHLRLAFIKVPILQHFDLKSHIRIETDASSYAIGKILSQLNFDSNIPSKDLNKSDFGQ